MTSYAITSTHPLDECIDCERAAHGAVELARESHSTTAGVRFNGCEATASLTSEAVVAA